MVWKWKILVYQEISKPSSQSFPDLISIQGMVLKSARKEKRKEKIPDKHRTSSKIFITSAPIKSSPFRSSTSADYTTTNRWLCSHSNAAGGGTITADFYSLFE